MAHQQSNASPTQAQSGASSSDLSVAHSRNQVTPLSTQVLQSKSISDNSSISKVEDAAETPLNISQQAFFINATNTAVTQPLLPGMQPGAPEVPTMAGPGPFLRPQGSLNSGQLNCGAMPFTIDPQLLKDDEGEGKEGVGLPVYAPVLIKAGRTRGGVNFSEEVKRQQQKATHKEIERRRRDNINKGINELNRIVPSGSREKSKQAILIGAVQYIHHLKENEALNIEKWTLEKVLIEHAIGELQAQLEETRNLWKEERDARQKVEEELKALRGTNAKNDTKWE